MLSAFAGPGIPESPLIPLRFLSAVKSCAFADEKNRGGLNACALYVQKSRVRIWGKAELMEGQWLAPIFDAGTGSQCSSVTSYLVFHQVSKQPVAYYGFSSCMRD